MVLRPKTTNPKHVCSGTWGGGGEGYVCPVRPKHLDWLWNLFHIYLSPLPYSEVLTHLHIHSRTHTHMREREPILEKLLRPIKLPPPRPFPLLSRSWLHKVNAIMKRTVLNVAAQSRQQSMYCIVYRTLHMHCMQSAEHSRQFGRKICKIRVKQTVEGGNYALYAICNTKQHRSGSSALSHLQ